MTTFSHRLLGAAALDVDTYEEVEADRGATGQAFLVVVSSSLTIGLGVVGFQASSWAGVLAVSTAAIMGWAAWALLTFEIGGRLLPEPQTRVDVTELLRTIGFAATPGFLGVLALVPEFRVPVFVATATWMLVAMVVAVRQALDYTSTFRAIVVCLFGWTLATAMVVWAGLWFASPVM